MLGDILTIVFLHSEVASVMISSLSHGSLKIMGAIWAETQIAYITQFSLILSIAFLILSPMSWSSMRLHWILLALSVEIKKDLKG